MKPKLDTNEGQLNKHFERSKGELLTLLDVASNLEYDLNTYADYCDMETLYEASKHATSIYHLIRDELTLKGVNLDE